MRKLFTIMALLPLFTSSPRAQSKGDFFICYGFEFPSGGYLSLQYFPVERIGVEVYSSAFWNLFNYGARLSVHADPVQLPHTFITIGYSHISAYGVTDLHDTTYDARLLVNRVMEGIDLGVGRETLFDHKLFSFQAGPTYALSIKDNFYTDEFTIESVEKEKMFSYYAVGTMLAWLPQKDATPMYVK